MNEFFSKFIPIYAKYLLPGLITTVELTIISYCIGLILGIVFSLMRIRKKGLLFIISTIYIDFFRRTPLIVQLLSLYYISIYSGIKIDIFMVGIIGLSLNLGAYLTEAFRGAIESIHKGQWEAGKAIGMSNITVARRIILPQALRILLPDLTNYLIMALLATSLVSVVSIRDLTGLGRNLISQYFRVEVWLIIALLYFCLSFPLSKIGGWLENRWKIEK